MNQLNQQKSQRQKLHQYKSPHRHKLTQLEYHQQGFTLIELLIAIAIVSVLVTIAVPSYQNYTRKAHYTEIVQATAPFKLGIEECFQLNGDLETCKAGINGVPSNIEATQGVGLVDSVVVTDKGIITVTPKNLYGITKQDNYIITPLAKNNHLIWATSGGGITKGYAK